ncbi:o-succinylbenzoate synthase [marine bacterium AO1-C]|nr:o-succinylbenzoate synthase [marine bacterium AO1-C]
MLRLKFQKHTLQFKFEAGTSRGILREHDVYYICLWDTTQPEKIGIGEAAPLKGLSIDYRPDFVEQLGIILDNISSLNIEQADLYHLKEISQLIPAEFPSIRFGVETAFLDWKNGGQKQIFNNPFFQGKRPIPINGLIWMGDEGFMQQQIAQKLEEGFGCIKMKIGAINFDQECQLLSSIRQKFSAEKLILRVDANGAFKPNEALEKLHRLSEFKLHSIEQPIRPNQLASMRQLCEKSPVPIALDEELIGKLSLSEKERLLDVIKPPYIILKPTLLGGFVATQEWITLAKKRKIGWWITSALESNIGLNAIAQFTAEHDTKNFHGLGTGSLYHNNVTSPLTIVKDRLAYQPRKYWEPLPAITDSF